MEFLRLMLYAIFVFVNYSSFESHNNAFAFQSTPYKNDVPRFADRIPLETRRRHVISNTKNGVVCAMARRKNGSGSSSNKDKSNRVGGNGNGNNSNNNNSKNSNNNNSGNHDGSRRQYKYDNHYDADLLLEYSIDSFLRGDYDRTFSEDAASPLPGLSPRDTIDAALRSLRNLDDPEPSHGAAVLLRFCADLGRGERWGTATTTTTTRAPNRNETNANANPRKPRRGRSRSSRVSWKELLRGALTPTMLARRIRASEDFSGLLDWTKLDVTEGVLGGERESELGSGRAFPSDVNSNIAFVNAALYFDDETTKETIKSSNNSTNQKGSGNPYYSSPPELYQFKLAKMLGGVWLIDTVQRSPSTLFEQTSESVTNSTTTGQKRRSAPKGSGRRRQQQQQQQQQQRFTKRPGKQREKPIQKRQDKQKPGDSKKKGPSESDGGS